MQNFSNFFPLDFLPVGATPYRFFRFATVGYIDGPRRNSCEFLVVHVLNFVCVLQSYVSIRVSMHVLMFACIKPHVLIVRVQYV